MSLPFNLPAPSASRKPFMDYMPSIEVAPTVGLGKDTMIYVCDDQEELRRLGPRQPIKGPQQPSISDRGSARDTNAPDDTKRRPVLGSPRGDDYGQTGTERTQISGDD